MAEKYTLSAVLNETFFFLFLEVLKVFAVLLAR